MKHLRALLFSLATALSPVLATAAGDTPIPIAQALADFDDFCTFVRTEYAYFDAKKTDWPRACEQHRTQLREPVTRNDFIQVLERALGELYDAHAHLGTNTSTSSRLVPTEAQLVARQVDGRVRVTDVRAGSHAQAAGVREGDEIVAIDDRPVADVVDMFKPRALGAPDGKADHWALQVALVGRHDQPVRRLRLRAGSQERTVEFGTTRPERQALLSHRLHGDVAHVRLHNSLGEADLVPAFDAALAAMPGARALVLDLRDTPSGGTSTVARGLLGRLVAQTRPYQRHELVSERRATGIARTWIELVEPRGATFRGPVLVLVGPWTASMGEGLAIGLNGARGAPVVGRPMAHLLGALGETVLPHTGITVRVPAEKLFHVDGQPREAFLPRAVPASGHGGDDPALQFALDLARTLGRSHRDAPRR